MASQQLLVRLPEDLLHRLRVAIPARSRSAFIQQLLEDALPSEVQNQALLEAAIATEHDTSLGDDMAEWNATIGDGFDSDG